MFVWLQDNSNKSIDFLLIDWVEILTTNALIINEQYSISEGRWKVKLIFIYISNEEWQCISHSYHQLSLPLVLLFSLLLLCHPFSITLLLSFSLTQCLLLSLFPYCSFYILHCFSFLLDLILAFIILYILTHPSFQWFAYSRLEGSVEGPISFHISKNCMIQSSCFKTNYTIKDFMSMKIM